MDNRVPSFISSSDSAPGSDFQRDLPTSAPWARIACVAVILAVAAIGLREWSLRQSGRLPSISMPPGLWAWQRNLVREAPQDSTVLLGSSRMAFGFDQDEWVRCGGTSRPFMLAWPGGCPRPHLHDMAADQSFRGTLLVGVAPSLFFCHPANPFPMRVKGQIKLAQHWGPADEVQQRVRFLLEPRLSVLLKGDASLLTLLRHRIALPQRDGQIPPMRPHAFARCDEHGRMRMFEGFENRPQDMLAVQSWLQSWEPQEKLYPPADVTSILREVVQDVEAIRRRSGSVIFVRFPSTDWRRNKERSRFPREKYWDRLIDETGCLGVHFEDHDDLRDYDCPEWSHLTQADAITFTRRLYAIINQEK